MTIWFEACFEDIKEVNVERETGKYVIIKGRREAKDSDWRWYCKTREEAKQKLVESAQQNVAKHRTQLEYAEQKLFKVMAL